MGGGNTKENQSGKKEKGADDAEKKGNDLEAELKALKAKEEELKKQVAASRKELDETKAKSAAAAGASGAVASAAKASADALTITTVLMANQVFELKKLGIPCTLLHGKESDLTAGEEYVVAVNVVEDKMADMMSCLACPNEVRRRPRMVPEPPPPVDNAPAEDDEKKETEGGNGGEEAKEEKKKFELPKATVKSENAIALHEWDGKVTVKFTWVTDTTPFSEYCDPTGLNWWCKTAVRRAPGEAEDVKLQWRQGPSDEWKLIDALKQGEDEYVATLDLVPKLEDKDGNPTPLTGAQLRGFQSRWVVDDGKYLSPIQIPPDLLVKAARIPPVRAALKQLPPEQRELANIPNPTVRDGMLALDNIIPQNTWDVAYFVEKTPGVFVDGEHVLSLVEKGTLVALQKTKDPAIVSEIRKTALKAPFMAVNALLGQAGIKLDAIIGNADAFFFPKLTEPNFEALQMSEDARIPFETLRREMQDDINGLYPQFQGGIRVSYPPARVVEQSLKCKRPVANTTPLPVQFTWTMKDDTQYTSEHKIEFVYWKEGAEYSTAERVVATAEKETEKFGLTRTEKDVWKVYKAQQAVPEGRYRYHWVYDGDNFWDQGHPYDGRAPGNDAYKQFEVICHVEFGIGVSF